ncbi:hypothetical protein [Providencia manganoxydans]
MTTLDFNLVSIIKNAGGDPSDVTEAVWDGLPFNISDSKDES